MKKINYITSFKGLKIALFIIGISFSAHSVLGQSTNTEFFMSSSFTKTAFNPAKRPEKGYIGIPALTNFYLDYKTNTFNLDHFVFPGSPKAKTFLHPDITYDQFMKGIGSDNYLNSDFDYTFLGFGFYVNDLFLSFDASVRANLNLNVPEGIFKFIKKGVALNGKDQETHDLSNISANMNAFGQIGIGGSYPLLDQSLVVGTKVKVLLGIANARFNLDRMLINVDRKQWTMESQASMQVIYPGIAPKYDEDGLFDGFDTEDSSFGFSGFGLGFDFGAAFKPGDYFDFAGDLALLDNVTVSLGFTDIGFINWNKNNVLALATNPSKNILAGNYNITFEDNSNIFDNLTDSLNSAINLIEDPNAKLKTSSGLRATMNWGLEYQLIEDKLNLGILSATYLNTIKPITEFTLGGAYRPVSAVELGLSYSFVHSSFQTFGFALHLGPGFYIASDYIIPHINSDWTPTTSKALNLQFGFVIPIGKKH